MKRLLSAIVALLFVAAPAQAQLGKMLAPSNANQGYMTGSDALRLCAADSPNLLLECLGFLEGVSDLYMNERADAGEPPCYPADQTPDQNTLQQNFVAFLIAHPERRPEQGAKLVKASIMTRWCSK